jgi:XTP/dITP diphosphohydrolase
MRLQTEILSKLHNVNMKRMRELLIATKNQGKLKEIRELLKGLDLKITSLSDYPDLPGVVEDGDTFKSNAVKKAVTIAAQTKTLTIGEDSGLEVRALGNRPGIYSSRFAATKGKKAADKRNNAKLLRMLRGVPLQKRQARYRCFVALADGEDVVDVVSGSCEGLIALRAKGKNGFGYDPLFFLPRYHKTFGELEPRIKAKISHRSRAFRKIKKVLEGKF